MGQYYTAVIISENDDIKTVLAHDFGQGAKLMDFSWCGNQVVNTVLSLIHNQKAKVAFIGDYANDDPYDASVDFYASILPRESFEKYYKAAWDKNEKEKYKMRKYRFSKADMEMLDMDTIGKYLVNHDKSEYIDIEAYIKDAKIIMHNDYWAVNPLPLLTACGNGRGGGDFFSENTGFEDVGIWAFSTLEYTEHIPAGYKQACFIFKREAE